MLEGNQDSTSSEMNKMDDSDPSDLMKNLGTGENPGNYENTRSMNNDDSVLQSQGTTMMKMKYRGTNDSSMMSMMSSGGMQNRSTLMEKPETFGFGKRNSSSNLSDSSDGSVNLLSGLGTKSAKVDESLQHY